MEQTKDTNPTPGTQISAEQAGEVAGGTGECSATASVGTSGASVIVNAPTPGQAMIAIYDGAVEAASHVIETVVHAAK
jgi:hypothetical protein